MRDCTLRCHIQRRWARIIEAFGHSFSICSPAENFTCLNREARKLFGTRRKVFTFAEAMRQLFCPVHGTRELLDHSKLTITDGTHVSATRDSQGRPLCVASVKIECGHECANPKPCCCILSCYQPIEMPKRRRPKRPPARDTSKRNR